MRQAIYYELKKRINNEFLAKIGTEILYCLNMVKLFFRSITVKKKSIELIPEEEALNIISEACPFKAVEEEIINQPQKENVACSVVIPVYNHENEIERCIDSAIQQECEFDYEILIIDDGSNEATKCILKKYENQPKCRVIYQDNQGIAGARNTGINQACGKYIMFIDCDDVIDPTMLQKLLSSAFENDSDIAFGGYRLVKERNGKAYSTKEYVFNQWVLNTHSSENRIMAFPGYPWGKIYKRELWQDVRYLKGYLYEDSIIQFLLYRKCRRYSYVKEAFYNYKWYERNFSKIQNSAANPKGVQRYWMLKIMIGKSASMGLPEDETFYITLLRHLGGYYRSNVKDFNADLRMAMFSLGCSLLKRYKREGLIRLTYPERLLEKSLLEGNYELWDLACRFQ